MDYRFLPDVVLDGLDTDNELIDEVETAVSCLSYCEASPHHERTQWKLDNKKKEENGQAVIGGGSDLRDDFDYHLEKDCEQHNC